MKLHTKSAFVPKKQENRYVLCIQKHLLLSFEVCIQNTFHVLELFALIPSTYYFATSFVCLVFYSSGWFSICLSVLHSPCLSVLLDFYIFIQLVACLSEVDRQARRIIFIPVDHSRKVRNKKKKVRERKRKGAKMWRGIYLSSNVIDDNKEQESIKRGKMRPTSVIIVHWKGDWINKKYGKWWTSLLYELLRDFWQTKSRANIYRKSLLIYTFNFRFN